MHAIALMWILAGSPSAGCPEPAAKVQQVQSVRAPDWKSLAKSWLAAFKRAHPREEPPALADDPAVLRRQACLPRAPDGSFVNDPNEVERLHAVGGCAGEGPWLLALGPGDWLTVVERDPKRGDLVIRPEALQLPAGRTARIRISGERATLEASGCPAVTRTLAR